ncbi:hypothetical protein JCM24511_04546 [Saitozyma sp. JCM 24511]|nr:hypothetical protein JCM24511_04546 [Saitozyma sp. JCM 24511]
MPASQAKGWSPKLRGNENMVGSQSWRPLPVRPGRRISRVATQQAMDVRGEITSASPERKGLGTRICAHQVIVGTTTSDLVFVEGPVHSASDLLDVSTSILSMSCEA